MRASLLRRRQVQSPGLGPPAALQMQGGPRGLAGGALLQALSTSGTHSSAGLRFSACLMDTCLFVSEAGVLQAAQLTSTHIRLCLQAASCAGAQHAGNSTSCVGIEWQTHRKLCSRRSYGHGCPWWSAWIICCQQHTRSRASHQVGHGGPIDHCACRAACSYSGPVWQAAAQIWGMLVHFCCWHGTT